MISRLCRTLVVVAGLAAPALLTVSCQKVPLLAPSGSTITLTAAATALPVNGSTDVIAQVIEAGGTPPHSGTLITFTTNLGTIQPSEAQTDLSGRVTVKYYAGSGSGTATVTALSGGVSAGGTNAIKIAVGAAAVGGIALSANPTTLPASGGTTTIAAVVNDSGGNPLPGVPVTFSTDNGSLATSVVTTDANGRAATTLATSRTAKVTATAGVATTSGTTTTAASTNTVTVTVNASAAVAFGTFSPATPVAGQPVSFTLTITPSATGGVIQSAVVNFGDGRSQTLGAVSGATPLSHTYDSPGTYTLTATATDSNGDAFSAAAGITVSNRPPANVTIVANPVAPQVGQQVAFTVTTTFPSTNTALVQSVSVDFGDGTSVQPGTQTTAIAQHVYSTAGTYTATALVRDTSGGTTTAQTQVTVSPRSGLAVTIASATTTPTIGTPTSFTIGVTATAGVPITSMTVDFGDGTRQTFPGNTTSVQRVYTTAGTYVVTATATDSSSASGSASMVVLVSARPQLTVTIALASGSTSPTTGTSTSFTIGATATNGSAITSILVDFGDGTRQTFPGNTTSVQRIYAVAGTYVATATATDSSGASGSASTVVLVSQPARPNVSISVSGTAQPTTGTVTVFNITASTPTGSTATIRSVTVDFGDGSTVDLGGQSTSGTATLPAQHIYQSANTYRVTATVQDSNGSSNSAALVVVVQARQPLGVSISVVKDAAITGTVVVKFTAAVTPAGTTIARYDWNFGDATSQTTTGAEVTHSYATGQGFRTVSVTVYSTDGQSATNTTVVVP